MWAGDAINTLTAQTALEDLLDAVVSVLASPPGRQLVVHGAFAHDCEMVGVEVLGWNPVKPDPNAECLIVHEVTLAATVLRCIETPSEAQPIPGSSGITADAMVCVDDLARMMTLLPEMMGDGTLFTLDRLDCKGVTWGEALPIGPEGGVAGWRISLTLRA